MDEFGKLSARVARPQTFMEIAGYPHYENVCSNFLAFFLDPEGPHGMGSLFLDALWDALNGAESGEAFRGNVTVEREVSTSAGNRIDILIRSDSYAVLIENKVFAAVANPFEDYATYLNTLKDEDGVAYENKYKILLTLNPSGEGANWGFTNLRHSDLASAVRSSLGHYVSGADSRYLTLMLDLLNTLEHLGKGTGMTPRTNQDFIKLLAERTGDVEMLLAGLREFWSEARGKVRELGTLIDVESQQNVQQYNWRSNVSLMAVLQHYIEVDGKPYIGVDTVIYPRGWEIQIYPYRVGARSEVKGLLNELGIQHEEKERFIYAERFDYGADLTLIAPVLQGILGKLSRSVD